LTLCGRAATCWRVTLTLPSPAPISSYSISQTACPYYSQAPLTPRSKQVLYSMSVKLIYVVIYRQSRRLGVGEVDRQQVWLIHVFNLKLTRIKRWLNFKDSVGTAQ